MPFSVQTLDFLAENHLRDDKAWYQSHKDMYQQEVAAPFSAFITAMQPTMHEIDSQIVCDPKRFSRLYRDARYARGQSVFRDNMWCSFYRRKESYDSAPGYYFEFSPRGYEYGCGYYHASTLTMEALRSLILADDITFRRALRAYEKQDVFTLEGEFYKRNHYPAATAKQQNWLNRKTLCLCAYSKDFSTFFSDCLAGKIAEDFVKLAPIYHFFQKAEEIAAQQSAQQSTSETEN